MKNLLLLTILFWVNGANAGPCVFTPAKLAEFISMNFQEFDQTKGKGFREFGEKNCYFEAALAIDAWRTHHESGLEDWQNRILFFHGGQAYANVDKSLNAIAVSHFQKSKDPNESTEQELKWNAYVEATIAFLNKDKPFLLIKRNEVAVSKNEYNMRNLAIVDRFIKCFDQSYFDAYNAVGNCSKSGTIFEPI